MKADLTDITLIVDRSGSMASIAEESRNGIKTFVEEQKKVAGACVLSLVQFDNEIERPFTAKPLDEVGAIPLEPRGATALLDAIGSTIEATGVRLAAMPEDQRPGREMIVIITDGHENASLLYDQAKVFEMISHQRDVYQWDFVFLGANQDAIATASKIGIANANALSYAADAAGTNAVWAATAGNVARARSTGSAMAAIAYSEAQRSAAMGKGPRKKTSSK
jgi:hypothetical protein